MDFPTQTEVEAGVDAYNTFIADVWNSKQDEIHAIFTTRVRELVEQEDLVAEVLELTLDLAQPPRLRLEGALANAGILKILFEAPGEGTWSLHLKARIFSLFRKKKVKLDIRELGVKAEVEVERSSPVDITFKDSDVKVHVDIDVGGLGTLIAELFNVVDNAVEFLARDALKDSLPSKEALDALANLGLGAEPVPVESAPPLTELEAAATAVSARIREHHLPFDTILNTLVAKNDIDGPAQGYRQYEDSAIWTGHFIAGEVYRHRVSQSPDALANIDKALDGLDQLLHLTADDGLLSRVVVPLEETEIVETLDQERIAAGHKDRLFTSADGRFRSIGHITRDQYAGAFLGTGMAALLLDDAALQAKARGLALEMLQYLVPRHFCPTEAEKDPDLGIKTTSTTYLGNPSQALAILQIARRLDPETYGEDFEKFFPIWSVHWLILWLQTLDPHSSYFKFNLEHGLALMLLTLEDDPDRRKKLALGLRTVRSAIRFHANAWFNLVELATLGDDEDVLSRPKQKIVDETRFLIAQAFERPPLIETVDLSQDPSLQVVEFKGEKIASQPVAVVKRPGADFLWQRSPFNLEVVWANLSDDPAMRSPNLDLTLPYWMARDLEL